MILVDIEPFLISYQGFKGTTKNKETNRIIEASTHRVLDALAKLPTVEREWEVEHAYWIEETRMPYTFSWSKIYRCSRCQKVSDKKTSFCGNCGRKMVQHPPQK